MKLLLDWMDNLPLQQQAVLVLACRGFDGTVKHSAHKPIVRTVRALCMKAAKYGRAWEVNDGYSDFMTLDYIKNNVKWQETVEAFIAEWDSYNVHAALHLLHAVEVLGYKAPNPEYRMRFLTMYKYMSEECLHMEPETEADMDRRLNDWNRILWS